MTFPVRNRTVVSLYCHIVFPACAQVAFADRMGDNLPGEVRSEIADSKQEGWLSPVEGTRLEIERGRNVTVGSNPTPSDP